jgi:hypothetical protein
MAHQPHGPYWAPLWERLTDNRSKQFVPELPSGAGSQPADTANLLPVLIQEPLLDLLDVLEPSDVCAESSLGPVDDAQLGADRIRVKPGGDKGLSDVRDGLGVSSDAQHEPDIGGGALLRLKLLVAYSRAPEEDP